MAAHSADEVYKALLALTKTGTTSQAIRSQPVLVSLRYIARAATTEDQPHPTPSQLAAVARHEIHEAAGALGTETSGVVPKYTNEAAAARQILGTRTSERLHQRRENAARELKMNVDTMLHRRRGVRTHEERVVAHVADVMWERETECVLGVVFAELQERTPEGSDLAVELLYQYRHYYRMWTALDGLRADVAAVLQIRRQGEDDVNKLDDYVRSSLHWYARYQQLMQRFKDDYGGQWLFSDADLEQSVIDAIKLVENFSRLTYRQDSQLRVLVADQEELDPFLRALEATQEGLEIIAAWQRHLDECDCDLEHPRSGCKVHLLMTACQYYIDAIDTECYALAPWYRGMPKYRKIIDPASLYEAIGLKTQKQPGI